MRVSLIHSKNLINSADCLPSNVDRASAIFELMRAFGYFDTESDNLTVIESVPASAEELKQYHSENFVDSLLENRVNTRNRESKSSSSPPRKRPRLSGDALREGIPNAEDGAGEEGSEVESEEEEKFGLIDDCPMFDQLSEYVKEVAGASLTAARELKSDRSDIGINWHGGRHHAKKSEASGFCYVSDIVLAIDELRRGRGGKVIYLDFDLHFGDGPSSAFTSSANVLTLSIHLFAKLFFPNSGSIDSIGKVKYHDLSIATNAGLSSKSLLRLFHSCIEPILRCYPSHSIVVQLGVDGLAEDPCNEWNLSLLGLGAVLKAVLKVAKETNQKVLLLGGGGYKNESAARAYSYFTSIALGTELSLDSPIPDSVENYESFAPSFTLDVEAGYRRDENSEEKLLEIESKFASYIDQLQIIYFNKKRCP